MNDVKWRESRQASPVILDTDQLINGHMLFAGMSGTGKSYQLQSLLESCVRNRITVDAFDVHEELHEISNSKAVKFSEATQAGYNPLVVNLDPHSGGPRKQIAMLIDMINRTSRQLGDRQKTALRYLVEDLYWLRGIYPDVEKQSSWRKPSLTEREWDRHRAARNFDAIRAHYPILRDVIEYAERKVKMITTGSDNVCMNALERVEQSASRLNNIMSKYNRAASDDEVARLEKQMANEKAKAIESYANYIEHIETGREFADMLKYTNKDVLISVIERLRELQNSGIFCSNAPDFGDALVRVYHVGSLSDDERRLLFYNRAQQILRESMDAGKTPSLRRIIVVDEGHLYYSEDGDNPMNRIAKEGRKFGLGLVVGSQSPTHFSEDFLTNCGAVFLMGIHEQYWDMAARKLRIDLGALRATRAREVLSVKMHALGEASAKFQTVNVERSVVATGMQVIRDRAAKVAA